MSDLTVIFLTTNDLPKKWTAYHKGVLLKAIGNANLITISKKPLDFGKNILQKEPRSRSNVYRQMLKGAEIADTEYIAIAEDDTLYCPQHFLFRPPDRYFYYNLTHWSLFTWGSPIFHHKNRDGNYALISNRELMIEILHKVFEKYPQGIPENRVAELGRPRMRTAMGIDAPPLKRFNTIDPIINFNHDRGIDDYARRRVKRMGYLRAYEIPYWGRAEELVKKWE